MSNELWLLSVLEETTGCFRLQVKIVEEQTHFTGCADAGGKAKALVSWQLICALHAILCIALIGSAAQVAAETARCLA